MKMNINVIQNCILKNKYRVSEHAVKRMIKRSIEQREMKEVILNGEIIEEYSDDKYSPSCLIYGKAKTGRDIHVQVSLPPEVVIITIYEPTLQEWKDCKVRR